ncbi:hypothetical protein [Mesorhizobium sp. WSM3224]|nr:hypothetical protein [Mesorhizobium sp. WSM3224]
MDHIERWTLPHEQPPRDMERLRGSAVFIQLVERQFEKKAL